MTTTRSSGSGASSDKNTSAASNKPAAANTDDQAAVVASDQKNEQAVTTVAREHGDPANDNFATGTQGTGFGDINAATAPASLLERSDPPADSKRVENLEPVPVFNPNAGLGVRVGGPYLDVKEMEEAEQRRAVIEKRAPDYTNMAGSAGVPLYTAGQLAAVYNGGPALEQMILDNADNPKVGPNPVGESVLVGTNIDVLETQKAEREARKAWDNTKVTSHDNADTNFTDPSAVKSK